MAVAFARLQSTVDKNMATRMLRESPQLGARGATLARKSPQLGARGATFDGDEAPVVLPLLVYNGSPRWTAPGAVTELPAWSPEAQRMVAPFREWDYVLLSLQQQLEVGDHKLGHLPLANRSAATMRLQMERTPADLVARLRTEWERFGGDADKETRNVLHVWAGALLADMGGAKSTLPSENELDGIEEPIGETGEEHMTTVSQARFAEWFDGIRAEHVAEGIEQGIAQGVEQGMAQGVERGRIEGERTVLRRLAERRFGDSAEPLYPLLDKVHSTAKLEEIGEWLVADTIDQLIAKVEAAVADERIH